MTESNDKKAYDTGVKTMATTITVDELMNRDLSDSIIIDLRTEEYFSRGSLPEAVNISWEEFQEHTEENMSRIDRNKTVYLMCYTGRLGGELADKLEGFGLKTVNIGGGYAALVRWQLEHTGQNEEELKEYIRQVERGIIKKYRKSIWRQFTRGINEYDMIREGDRIAVCISGGKDSMLLAKLMQELKRHGKFPFELVFLCMNPGYNPDNWAIIQNNARILGIDLTVRNSEIFDTVADIEQNPCYLCARMRRGFLYAHAKELGCNKIALGHHFDDVIETTMMGMLYGGKFETMMPKLHSTNFEGMELIRPMYLVREEDIKAWRDYNGLHFIQCACRFTEQAAATEGHHESKRDEVKQLIAQLRTRSDVIDKNIFRSVHNVNLRTIIGYHRDDWSYCFLDDYDDAKCCPGIPGVQNGKG